MRGHLASAAILLTRKSCPNRSHVWQHRKSKTVSAYTKTNCWAVRATIFVAAQVALLQDGLAADLSCLVGLIPNTIKYIIAFKHLGSE